MKIDVPWRHLSTRSVRIQVDGGAAVLHRSVSMFVLKSVCICPAPNLFLFLFTCNSVYAICALRSAWDADELVQAETMARQAEIELRELLRRELIGDSDTAEEGGLDSSDKSYWTTLGLRMLENLQVHVTNVHVRFDGASEGHQFRSVAIGLTMESVSFRNDFVDGGKHTNSEAKQGTNPNVSKRFTISSVAVFGDESGASAGANDALDASASARGHSKKFSELPLSEIVRRLTLIQGKGKLLYLLKPLSFLALVKKRDVEMDGTSSSAEDDGRGVRHPRWEGTLPDYITSMPTLYAATPTKTPTHQP